MFKNIYPREKYLERIRPFYDSDIIKVITGIRRCGKKKKAEAAKAEQEASKKTDGRILLYSDIIDALYDEMPREEREALLEAKQQLE